MRKDACSKGQGALEYLLLIGGAVLVAVVIIVLVIGMVPTTGEQIETSIGEGQSEIDAAYQEAIGGDGTVTGKPSDLGTYPPVPPTQGCSDMTNSECMIANEYCDPPNEDKICKYDPDGCTCEEQLTITDGGDPFYQWSNPG